jgi:hypothetical protein
MRHKGVRPTYELQVLDFKRKIYIEYLPDDEYRVWNRRQLKSGCGKRTNVDNYEVIGKCYYCKHCDEWFNKEQWCD